MEIKNQLDQLPYCNYALFQKKKGTTTIATNVLAMQNRTIRDTPTNKYILEVDDRNT